MIHFISAIIITILVGIDQLIKYFVVRSLKPIGQKMLINGVLQLSYVENNGAMMDFMQGKTVFLTIAAFVMVIVLLAIIFSGKVQNRFYLICFVLIAAGGIGNLIDRIFRGYVVDYIEVLFVDFYVFNFADSLITVAAFMLIAYLIYDAVKDFKHSREAQ